MIGIIIAMISGALMSIQGVFNTQVAKVTGIELSNMWVQCTAFIVAIFIWLFTGREPILNLMKVEPRYLLTGGILGVGITFTGIKSMNALGPAKAVLLIVVTQIILAYLIQVLGLFQVEKVAFEWRKVIGALVAIVGLWIFNGGDA